MIFLFYTKIQLNNGFCTLSKGQEHLFLFYAIHDEPHSRQGAAKFKGHLLGIMFDNLLLNFSDWKPFLWRNIGKIDHLPFIFMS